MKGRRRPAGRVGPFLIAGLLLASVFVVCGTMAALQFTEPYAVNQDGEKVRQPWAVMVGGEEICLVESKTEGQAVIERIKAHYAQDMEHLQDISFSPEISVVEKELQRGEEAPKVTAPAWAAAEVVVQNETETPVVTVRTTETVEKTRKIEHETKYKDSDELYEGETKTTVKGSDGVAVVTSEIIRENGKIVDKQVVDTRVTKKAIPKIVHKGTKKRLEAPTVSSLEPITDSDSSPTSLYNSSEITDQSDENGTQLQAADQSGETESSDSEGNGQESERNKDSNSEENSSSGNNNNSSSKNTGKDDTEKNDTEKNNSNSNSNTSQNVGKQIAEYACKFIGNPYVYGGTSLTNGTDCSGFVMSVYKHFGIFLPRTSGRQALVGRSIAYSNAKPGDIVCYPGHVAIYIGNGRIVHASTPASGIKTSPATYRSIKTIRRVWD